MKLRFEINQADASRQGIDVQTPVVCIEVRRSTLSPEQQRLIAERLDGADLLQLHYDPGTQRPQKTYYVDTSSETPKYRPVRIQASEPTFDAMMRAIEANEAQVAPARRRIPRPPKGQLSSSRGKKPARVPG